MKRNIMTVSCLDYVFAFLHRQLGVDMLIQMFDYQEMHLEIFFFIKDYLFLFSFFLFFIIYNIRRKAMLAPIVANALNLKDVLRKWQPGRIWNSQG